MRRIRISDATHRALRALADGPVRAIGKQQADGTWLVPVDDEAFEMLRRHRLPGETNDDAIMRLIRLYQGRWPH